MEPGSDFGFEDIKFSYPLDQNVAQASQFVDQSFLNPL